MSTVLKGFIAAALLAGSTVAATAPAQADRGSGAVIAGLLGLGIGAAIASDHHPRRYADPVDYYGQPQLSYYDGGYGYAEGYGYGGGYGGGYGYVPHGGYGYRDRGGWDRRDWRGTGRRDDRRYDGDRREWDRH